MNMIDKKGFSTGSDKSAQTCYKGVPLLNQVGIGGNKISKKTINFDFEILSGYERRSIFKLFIKEYCIF